IPLLRRASTGCASLRSHARKNDRACEAAQEPCAPRLDLAASDSRARLAYAKFIGSPITVQVETAMLLLKLSDKQMNEFDEQPEAGMGMHFARFNDKLGFVLSGRVVMFPHEVHPEGSARSQALMKNLWFGPERRKLDPANLSAASDADRKQEDDL